MGEQNQLGKPSGLDQLVDYLWANAAEDPPGDSWEVFVNPIAIVRIKASTPDIYPSDDLARTAAKNFLDRIIELGGWELLAPSLIETATVDDDVDTDRIGGWRGSINVRVAPKSA